MRWASHTRTYTLACDSTTFNLPACNAVEINSEACEIHTDTYRHKHTDTHTQRQTDTHTRALLRAALMLADQARPDDASWLEFDRLATCQQFRGQEVHGVSKLLVVGND